MGKFIGSTIVQFNHMVRYTLERSTDECRFNLGISANLGKRNLRIPICVLR